MLKRKAKAAEPPLRSFIIRMIKPGQLRSIVYNTTGGIEAAQAQAQWMAKNTWRGWEVFDVKPFPEPSNG